MSLLTWERYSSLHDIVSEDNFDKAEKQAECAIRNVMGVIHFSNWIADNPNIANEIYYEQLQRYQLHCYSWSKSGTGRVICI